MVRGTANSQDRFDEQSVVLGGDASIRGLARQQRGQPFLIGHHAIRFALFLQLLQ